MELLSYNDLKRAVKLNPPSTTIANVVLLGDTATQLLATAIKGYAIEKKMPFNLKEIDYDQIEMQLFSADSEVYAHQPDFVIIYKSSVKLLKKYYKCSISEKENFATDTIDTIKNYLTAIDENTNTKVVCYNFVELKDQVFYNFSNSVKHSWTYQIKKLNLLLMELSMETDNLFITDINATQLQMGTANTFDPQLFTRTDIVSNFNLTPAIALNTVDVIGTTLGKFKKCLILDLDNTTWGGIIGDDGIENIQIGSLGLGKAFSELQSWAKNLKERGIILAICSKNTESVAKEPFEKHEDMVLRLDDISVFVANWENKADNIRYIQSVLNIGFDSMVFLDDNPFERNLVRQQLPEVTVPELPKDPAEYIPYLQQFNLFETATFSGLDKDRTKQYQTEAKRKKLAHNYASIDDYLKNLEMTAEVVGFDTFNISRIAQLTQRSNQFNLRTIRYTEDDVMRLIDSPKHYTQYISLKDKFGNYGIISLVVLEKTDNDTLFIDTWIMSCRVLKRNVEHLVLNEIVEQAKAIGANTIIGERIPTKKNVLVEDHYKKLGFVEIQQKWKYTVDNHQALKHFIAKSIG